MIKSMRVLGLALVAAIGTGCTSDELPPPPADNSPGGGCNVDYTRLTSHPRVAFRKDVMPILTNSCGRFTACHASSDPSAGLVLGDVCQDAGGMCAPLTESAIDAIHANLLLASKTAPAVKRVAATKPAESFLLDKAADVQNKKGYACTPQASGVEGCGTGMPPGGSETILCTRRDGQRDFDIIAAWVLQGALND
jgi:hypothetical protein